MSPEPMRCERDYDDGAGAFVPGGCEATATQTVVDAENTPRHFCPTHAVEARRLRAAAIPDDPTLDETDGAHPAWWRGYDAGARGMAVVVRRALTEAPRGVYGSEVARELDAAVRSLRSERDRAHAQGFVEAVNRAVATCDDEEAAGVAERARLVGELRRQLYDLTRQEGRYHAANRLRWAIAALRPDAPAAAAVIAQAEREALATQRAEVACAIETQHGDIVRERDHYRERAATHHRRGDQARHEAALLRRRVEALEQALDGVAPHLAIYNAYGLARCPECGQDYEPADAERLTHAKSCRIGHALRLRRQNRR